MFVSQCNDWNNIVFKGWVTPVMLTILLSTSLSLDPCTTLFSFFIEDVVVIMDAILWDTGEVVIEEEVIIMGTWESMS